jgi:hypothetical protein
VTFNPGRETNLIHAIPSSYAIPRKFAILSLQHENCARANRGKPSGRGRHQHRLAPEQRIPNGVGLRYHRHRVGGFLSFWNKGYWLPFIIIKFIFGWGAGYPDILHMMKRNNFSPSNTGIVVYWDFLFPLVMIVLYVLYQRQQRN